MSAHRFFLAEALPGVEGEIVLPLSAADLHHAYAVLRVRQGESIELVDPVNNVAWSARVVSATRDALTVAILGEMATERIPRVTLVQGVAKGEKMDLIVRQAVEVGASEIIPVLTSRVVVRMDQQKRHERGERWRRVAKAAAEQSRRGEIPEVRDPMPFADCVTALESCDSVAVLWEDAAQAPALGEAVSAWGREAPDRVAVVIGPEGGLSEDEVDALGEVGGTLVTLGPGVLRTETAAVVALALTIDALGGLGGGRG